MTVTGVDSLTGDKVLSGVVQIAKLPQSDDVSKAEKIYDEHAGTYALGASISGTVSGKAGTYSIRHSTAGSSPSGLLMFALPHHVASWTPEMDASKQDIQLKSTTKGMMQAYGKSDLTMREEDLPSEINFLPWSPTLTNISYSPETLQKVASAANEELQQDMSRQVESNSVYLSGKALNKFAHICLVVDRILKDNRTSNECMNNLKTAIEKIATNIQEYPLVYDETYKGVVSSIAWDPSSSEQGDFGNTFYNNHNYQYGYLISSAAIIGLLDPSWADSNKDWVNTLVRDVANPSVRDEYFPQMRTFDFFHGHSWAHGIFETQDGKEVVSVSEDMNFAHAIKTWGKVSRNADLEAVGNVMSAILKRSANSYVLMGSKNTVQPPSYRMNMVAGLLFETKCDATTWISWNSPPEWVSGTHILPISPTSAYLRAKDFVQEEWNQFFQNTIDQVSGGWRGLLYSSLAISDARRSYQFFKNTDAKNYLDAGESLTWALAYAAGLGGGD